MTEWLRDGLEGRGLKATLHLYLFGAAVLAPIAALIGFLFTAETAFRVTPLLVLILGGIEYGVCYLSKSTQAANQVVLTFRIIKWCIR